MKVIWTPEAHQDRTNIWDYIAAENPQATARLDQLFSEAAGRLAWHPKMGRPGKVAGTREHIPHEKDCLVYEIQGDEVWVLALVHTVRQWPPVRSV